jgi:hypothetical protein
MSPDDVKECGIRLEMADIASQYPTTADAMATAASWDSGRASVDVRGRGGGRRTVGGHGVVGMKVKMRGDKRKRNVLYCPVEQSREPS